MKKERFRIPGTCRECGFNSTTQPCALCREIAAAWAELLALPEDDFEAALERAEAAVPVSEDVLDHPRTTKGDMSWTDTTER